MLNNNITSQQLLKALKSIGFVEIRQRGSHIMLAHPNSKAKIVIPVLRPKSTLPIGIVFTIRKVITENGLLTKEEFDEILNKGNQV